MSDSLLAVAVNNDGIRGEKRRAWLPPGAVGFEVRGSRPHSGARGRRSGNGGKITRFLAKSNSRFLALISRMLRSNISASNADSDETFSLAPEKSITDKDEKIKSSED